MALTWASPWGVRGISEIPVNRPLLAHSVSPVGRKSQHSCVDLMPGLAQHKLEEMLIGLP